MSPIKGRRGALGLRGGFTLFEVMLATFISAFVFAGVISAYIFMGRALSRQVNEQSLESRARLALYMLTQDVSTASEIYAASPGTQVTGDQMTLVVPGLGNVTYHCDWSLGATQGILERQIGSGPYIVLLKNLTSINFQYFDGTTNSVTVPSSLPTSPQLSIKQVCMTYTSSAGYGPSGNLSQFTVISPVLMLKNKSLLTDPNNP